MLLLLLLQLLGAGQGCSGLPRVQGGSAPQGYPEEGLGEAGIAAASTAEPSEALISPQDLLLTLLLLPEQSIQCLLFLKHLLTLGRDLHFPLSLSWGSTCCSTIAGGQAGNSEERITPETLQRALTSPLSSSHLCTALLPTALPLQALHWAALPLQPFWQHPEFSKEKLSKV